jgi:hypothetical protein
MKYRGVPRRGGRWFELRQIDAVDLQAASASRPSPHKRVNYDDGRRPCPSSSSSSSLAGKGSVPIVWPVPPPASFLE